MSKAVVAVFGAVFGVTLMVSAILASTELVHHSAAYTSSSSPELNEPARNTLTLSGTLFFVGLAALIASVFAPLIVMLVLLGWRALPFVRNSSEPAPAGLTSQQPTGTLA
jgi:hypothetical protein